MMLNWPWSVPWVPLKPSSHSIGFDTLAKIVPKPSLRR